MTAPAFDEILAARQRLSPYLPETPLRTYPSLDRAVGHGIRVFVKHENHLPTNAFKARNGLNALLCLDGEARARGVIAATRGNHGQGLAWAGRLLGIPVTVVVPKGNNPEKNEAMVDLGAELVIAGADYDECLGVVGNLVEERGLTVVHSTNNRHIIAGAATITLEMLEQEPGLDAMVVAVGGGSQAAGACLVAAARRPDLAVHAVQAANAAASHDSWHAGRPVTVSSADTFADGLATRSSYSSTLPVLQARLKGFVTVTEAEIAGGLRVLLKATHNLVEGAGATGLAGLVKLAPALAGKRVGVILSGGNIDQDTLCWVLNQS